MNKTNQFFQISGLVDRYQNAEFFTVYYYREKIESCMTMTVAIASLAFMIGSFVALSIHMLVAGMLLGATLFIYAHLSTTRPMQWISKQVAWALWHIAIDTSIRTTRQSVREGLHELRGIIQYMKNDAQEWREIALKAEKIEAQFI